MLVSCDYSNCLNNSSICDFFSFIVCKYNSSFSLIKTFFFYFYSCEAKADNLLSSKEIRSSVYFDSSYFKRILSMYSFSFRCQSSRDYS